MNKDLRVERAVISEEVDERLVDAVIKLLKAEKMTFRQAHEITLKVRDRLDEMSQRVDL